MKGLFTPLKRRPANTLGMAASAYCILLALSTGAHAAPGTIADAPLFLAGKVQPNIFFMVDDSGSMDWEVLLTAQAAAAHPSAPNSGDLDFTPDNNDERHELCYAYNAMAYNPNQVYTPWQGVDEDSIVYSNRTLTTALANPYDNDNTDDVSGHYYYGWNDANSNGVYDSGECSTVDSNRVFVNTLTAAQQINYANWYTYYRKREYVAKRALSQVIRESTARVGLATINGTNSNSLDGNASSIFSAVANVDNISIPINTAATTNKNNLLRSLFLIDSTNGTPLRSALTRVGQYYENLNPNSWGSTPILSASNGGECQQNFAVLMSDGFWNGAAPAVGNTDTDGAGTFDGGSYADTYSNTLADVAMDFYERDLSTLPNRVPVTSQPYTGDLETTSPYMHQHMTTYTVAFGVDGGTGFPPDRTTAFTWPNPLDAEDLDRVDDMLHAAWNSRGQYLSAKDPAQLIQSLNDAIKDIQNRTGTSAAVTFNSSSLQTNTQLLKATFNSNKWSGNLVSYNIDTSTTVPTLGTVAWDAAAALDARTAASREIVTFNGTDGVEFAWANLTAAQKNDLLTNSTGSLDTNEVNGVARLEYIRGDRNCEASSTATCSHTYGGVTYTTKAFRDRDSKLGDIVDSGPAYVGAPNTRYPESIASASYTTFAQTYQNRTPVVYVGANDGMLHAFDNTGAERFAYIPNALFSTTSGEGLHALADGGYIHNYYVDLSPAVADAFVDLDQNGTAEWHSILVGGLRGGGKGLFAIDVTDPSAMTNATQVAGKVLWEFTNNNLGYTFSDIRIGKLNNGKWAAIFGNGYNSDPTGDGTSKVFIVYLDGTNVASPIVLETGRGTIASGDCDNVGSDCNGMSTPVTLDLNGDGTIDRIYAGDLHGYLWAFDVSSSSTGNWKSAYGTGPTYTALFQACSAAPCTTTNRQPITSKPSVTRHPYRRDLATQPNLLVYFGTGQYITQADNTAGGQQSFYGVWDFGTGGLDRDDLVAQTLTDTTTAEGVEVRTITDNNVDYISDKGWRIDLNVSSKERVVTNSIVFGSLVFFNTMMPGGSPCSAGGDGWLMALDLVNGGEPSFQPIDQNGDGYFDASDKVGSTVTVGTRASGIPTESRFISNKRVTATSDGSVRFDNVQPFGPDAPNRMSWTGLER